MEDIYTSREDLRSLLASGRINLGFNGRITVFREDHTYYSTYWYLNGIIVMYKADNLRTSYFKPRYGDNLINPCLNPYLDPYLNSFEELFESFSEEHKEIVIWNLDLWK